MLGCLFHNHLDVLCPGDLGMGVCSTKRSHVPLESPYVTAFAGRGCVQRICPEMLILGKGSIFLPRSVRRNRKGPRRCRRRGRVLSSHPEPRASPAQGCRKQPSVPRPLATSCSDLVCRIGAPSTLHQPKFPSGAFGSKLTLTGGIVMVLMSLFS